MAGLATRLRLLRTATGETQTEVGSAVGAGQRTVWGWESSRVKPDPEMLVRLADHFQVSVDYLIGRTDDPMPPRRGASTGAARLSRWLREAVIEKRVSLHAVAAATRIPLAVLLEIQEGTAADVSPLHLRQIAGYFGRPEQDLRGMLSPVHDAGEDADTVSGIAADAEGDLTAEERREVEAVIKDIRRRRRQREGDRSPG